MKSSFALFLTVFLCLYSPVSMKADEPYIGNSDFEKIFLDGGYKDVYKALQESKDHFKRTIVLPTQLPPIAFTHHFGRFSNLDGDLNDGLEITYLNKDFSQNHYMISVKPAEYRLTFRQEHIKQSFKLTDGTKAIFSNRIEGFHLLMFEKDGWQYILSVDKRISDIVTPKVLAEIANSIK